MNNNVLIITGSDGATAQALIDYFADKYKHVIGFSRQQKTSYPQDSVEIMNVDMLEPRQIIAAIDTTIEKYGEINGWINCVGGFDMGNLIEDEDNWDEMYSINFTTCLNGCRAIIPQFKKQNHGCIINFGSKAALDGFPTAASYLISKTSVHSLTKLISIEMGSSQARCNAMLPGIIDTKINRKAMPDEDYSTWESPKDIASKINYIFSSKINGELITL
jgi:NADP-dependent 3-hydroxy acid dehydrogenase YdfG